MKHSLKVGFSFGLTSGIITTLGLMVGLNSGTHSKLVVLGGILTIAVADSLSDALGIHIAEESEGKHTEKEIWQSTIATFITKFLFALTFVFPVIFFELTTAMIVSLIWGLLAISVLSYKVAKEHKLKVVVEHIAITMIVIVVTHFVGAWIGSAFA